MQVIKITSEKKHKIETIALWMILILSTAVLFSLCLNEGIDYDEAYSYRTAHDNTMLGIIRVVLDAHDTDVPVWYMGLRLWSFLVGCHTVLLFHVFVISSDLFCNLIVFVVLIYTTFEHFAILFCSFFLKSIHFVYN